MSIIAQQISASQAMVNGRTITGQKGKNWVINNWAISQLRYSDTDRNSDLVSGYFPGGEGLAGARDPFMYPDNRPTLEGSDVVSSSRGIESIKDSRTAAQLG